jgi:hypothetical protein
VICENEDTDDSLPCRGETLHFQRQWAFPRSPCMWRYGAGVNPVHRQTVIALRSLLRSQPRLPDFKHA